MPLTKFESKAAVGACGLTNIGSICYLNSFLQSLVSCTALNKFFLDNEQRFIEEGKKVAIEYISLIKEMQKCNGKTINPAKLFQTFIMEIRSKYPNKKFGRGQEDSGEGLHLFLDMIDDKGLYEMFMYKYCVKIWCLTCDKKISERHDESCVLEIPLRYSGIKSEIMPSVDPLNLHILQYVSILSDYTCSECKKKKCFSIYQLSRLPEIITVMFNKFAEKKDMAFSQQMQFPSTDDTTLKYNIVAKIEHSGGRNGGHYWAHCVRRVGDNIKIANLNDSSVTQGNFSSTPNTYMLFYHVI
jgi:ubiquitin C-terminal hydrolase